MFGVSHDPAENAAYDRDIARDLYAEVKKLRAQLAEIRATLDPPDGAWLRVRDLIKKYTHE